jgi:hypothetical protein
VYLGETLNEIYSFSQISCCSLSLLFCFAVYKHLPHLSFFQQVILEFVFVWHD